jgi:predicted RNA methylase
MKVSTEVLRVLSTCLRFDGNCVVIVQQLDRKLYTHVNKVLEACGGTWSRKARAHVFIAWDPAEKIEQVLATGEVTVAKSDLCFFPTPVALARRLVKAIDIQPGHVVLEPSAGTGRIVEAINEAGGYSQAVERDPAMRAALVGKACFVYDVESYRPRDPSEVDDFLTIDPTHAAFDRVAMNPPFTKCGLGDGLDHVLHALKFLKVGGKLGAIMPNGILFREDRRHRAFRDALPYGTTFTELPEGAFKESGTNVRTVLVVAERVS